MNPSFLTFPTRDALAETLAEDVAARLHHAITLNDEAALVVSGGSTPAPFFQALAAKPLDWSKVTLLMADERWVEVTHGDSNEKLLRFYFSSPLEGEQTTHGLQSRSGVVGGNISQKSPHQNTAYFDSPSKGELRSYPNILSLAPASKGESLQAGCARIADLLDTLPSPLDVVILGMGEDGHTASLFPHHPDLESGLNPDNEALCLAITDSPKPPANRITLTARLLLDCNHLILHITGDTKKAVYERALVSDEYSLPIAAFISQPYSPLTTYWAA
jgi:6-phosphogluconolactonase